MGVSFISGKHGEGIKAVPCFSKKRSGRGFFESHMSAAFGQIVHFEDEVFSALAALLISAKFFKFYVQHRNL
ncbi:hypothetical protein AXF13_07980 [Desulfovibrio fairfieldensis]|uniref:Uncharacterized protein n=1 Tax=Desulfovibrio fairfieldensis TaxID=44742 RepID=A0A109W4A2_9BACT|nr:hypothetical protein AXF13_07980 [Desulfovibrio fairfieldensis]